ncbi:MAG: hypothetical protein IPN30_08445 [Flavobacteriales bacterium]|nr:hypothetical protein [Flavobacteriales bacterium]
MPLQPVFTRPSALLAPYISYLFELESAPPADAEPHRVNVLPVPHAQMVFSFGGPSFERVMGGEQKPSPDFALTGYTTRTMEYSNPGHLGVVMAGFHPWGLQPFFEKTAAGDHRPQRTTVRRVQGRGLLRARPARRIGSAGPHPVHRTLPACQPAPPGAG